MLFLHKDENEQFYLDLQRHAFLAGLPEPPPCIGNGHLNRFLAFVQEMGIQDTMPALLLKEVLVEAMKGE